MTFKESYDEIETQLNKDLPIKIGDMCKYNKNICKLIKIDGDKATIKFVKDNTEKEVELKDLQK